jgi:hypothetical protein
VVQGADLVAFHAATIKRRSSLDEWEITSREVLEPLVRSTKLQVEYGQRGSAAQFPECFLGAVSDFGARLRTYVTTARISFSVTLVLKAGILPFPSAID